MSQHRQRRKDASGTAQPPAAPSRRDSNSTVTPSDDRSHNDASPASATDQPPREEVETSAGPRTVGPRMWSRNHNFMAFESWIGSFTAHALLIVALACIGTVVEPDSGISDVLVRQSRLELLERRLDAAVTPAPLPTFVGARRVVGPGGVGELSGDIDVRFRPAALPPGPQLDPQLDQLAFSSISGSPLIEAVDAESPGDPVALAEGTDQAMDRIAQELAQMLTEGKVLVIWLFDESGSMEEERREIRERLHRVYTELGIAHAGNADLLRSAVVSFGAKTRIETKRPTGKLNEVMSAIQRVPVDKSGKEMIFHAVAASLQRFRDFYVRGKWQIALVIASDESGDDGDYLEEAIAEAKRAQCRVYAMGREAVFGYPYAHVRWVHEASGFSYQRQVRRGPETAFPEQLQTNGLWRRYDSHSSGFGPYELARLCRQTGGIFFLLPSSEASLRGRPRWQYDYESLRPYMPDLKSRRQYLAIRDEHALRSEVWKLIQMLDPWRNEEINLRQVFPLDRRQFVRRAVEEQRKAKVLLGFYERAATRLGELASLREQEILPRWQANYDLIFAQIVGNRIRVRQYNDCMERFKKSPTPLRDSKSNRWVVRMRRQTTVEHKSDPDVERATRMFQHVIEEHPGTPYASRARWELGRGFGVDLYEDFDDPRRQEVLRKITLPNL